MDREQAQTLLRVVVGVRIEDIAARSMAEAEAGRVEIANHILANARNVLEAAQMLGITPAINRYLRQTLEDGDSYKAAAR